jgi:cyclic pyranopterin phosphate synthase
MLRFEEIQRIVRLFAEYGIRKIRLTGGEPLIRRNVIELVRELAVVSNIEDLALTTNGVLLEQMAEQLKAAGLMRVNVSLDSVQKRIYRRITGFDVLERVMAGIRKAIEVGLAPVRINAIILKGINEQDIAGLTKLALEMPVGVRFIEYCPTHKDTVPEGFFVPNSQVRRSIEGRFGALVPTVTADGNGPAVYFKIKGAAGTVGFISGRTKLFCQSCNRLRLTSDGEVRPCLYSAHSYDLKELIRGGASDEQILTLLKRIIAEKDMYTKLNSFAQDFSMRNVGG